jgi:pseudaminic acid biosynthesis-associated methylase
MDDLYQKNYGVSRTNLNNDFLDGIDKKSRILEVGCNVGCQLGILQRMGFSNLYGVELQAGAVEIARKGTENINVIQGSAFDIPFRDGFFDLVFTSGVLIHISPDDISQAMAEIYRCTRKYIWGFEYYAAEQTEVSYRGHEGLLWKADFAALYQQQFPDLKLIRQEIYPYLDDDNRDVMFLLSKAG